MFKLILVIKYQPRYIFTSRQGQTNGRAALTCWATTDSTSRSILLNSSKQAQAPADARPLKNCHRRENKVSGRSNHSVCIVILGSARPLKNCQRRENKVSGRSNHSVILGGARPLKNYHRENKISGSSNHSVYIVILVRACVGP